MFSKFYFYVNVLILFYYSYLLWTEVYLSALKAVKITSSPFSLLTSCNCLSLFKWTKHFTQSKQKSQG